MEGYIDWQTLFFFFIVYSVIGWLLEVIFHIYTEKKLINRGFLYGPICPIYGNGAVLMITFLTPLEHNVLYLFIGGVVVATVIEYITGYILELAFDTKWWDYSSEPWNIKGYICIRFSLMWGIGALFLMKVIHPKVASWIAAIPSIMVPILYHGILIAFVVDLTLTIHSLIEFRTILKELRAIKEELNKKLKDREQEWDLIKRAQGIQMKFKKRHISFLRIYPHLTKGKLEEFLKTIKSKKRDVK
ncbi:MAG: putative ABC transporter permease [Epulopiscium sp.]|nr:putative ABC transporter permease [Candidatus Epulonipiscium sp.]